MEFQEYRRDLLPAESFAMESFSFTPKNTDGLKQTRSMGDLLQMVAEEENRVPSYFKPATILVKDGVHHVSIFTGFSIDGTSLSQRLCIFFQELTEKDEVHLRLTSHLTNVAPVAYLSLIAAIGRCKASVKIYLDTIVDDELAYFYLACPELVIGSMGALMIPSYCQQIPEDMSSSWREVSDFFKWLVELAQDRGLITSEQAQTLHSGQDVEVDLEAYMAKTF
jgi:hypothetical protein